jgi:hypothetical protein
MPGFWKRWRGRDYMLQGRTMGIHDIYDGMLKFKIIKKKFDKNLETACSHCLKTSTPLLSIHLDDR